MGSVVKRTVVPDTSNSTLIAFWDTHQSFYPVIAWLVTVREDDEYEPFVFTTPIICETLPPIYCILMREGEFRYVFAEYAACSSLEQAIDCAAELREINKKNG